MPYRINVLTFNKNGEFIWAKFWLNFMNGISIEYDTGMSAQLMSEELNRFNAVIQFTEGAEDVLFNEESDAIAFLLKWG
jgi:hypothetical protein